MAASTLLPTGVTILILLGFQILAHGFVISGSKSPRQLSMASETSFSAQALDAEVISGLLNVAVDASKKAGAIIMEHAGGATVERSKANERDLLTLVDTLCEKTIRESVLKVYPDHDFLGEESVPPGKEASAAAIKAILSDDSKSDFLWIVDPIDGTTNFANGLPLSAPSIAVAYRGEVVAGAIYDPHRDELFTATKGGGAQMNGNDIQVGAATRLADAIVAMGSPPGEESMQMSMKGAKELMPVVRSLRMLGSAAIMLAWVANGRLTCYWEYDLSCWDVAAGSLLVKEAGGQMTDLKGEDFSLTCRKICATNGGIHGEVLQALKKAGIA